MPKRVSIPKVLVLIIFSRCLFIPLVLTSFYSFICKGQGVISNSSNKNENCEYIMSVWYCSANGEIEFGEVKSGHMATDTMNMMDKERGKNIQFLR